MATQKRPMFPHPNMTILAQSPATVFLPANLSSSEGGPLNTFCTLWVSNKSAAAADVLLKVQGVASTLTVPARTTIQVFDDQPFLLTAAGGGITAQTAAATPDTLVVWGSYRIPL